MQIHRQSGRRALGRRATTCLIAMLFLVLIPAVAGAAKVTYLIKPAQVKHADSRKWEFLNLGDQVHQGDSVRTGSGGRVELSITPKRQFRIGQATEILLEHLDEAAPAIGLKARVKLLLGRFWGSLRKPLSRGGAERVSIVTTTAVIGVKGTTFGVDHDKKRKATVVSVVSGLIEAMPPPVETGPPKQIEGPREIAPPQEVSREEWTQLVAADQKLIIRPGEIPTTQPLTDADKKDEWIAFNIARDNL
ncbi:MAG: FecR family protein [SAR324 cluster bacterium]|nr:FecR family protein [SAR324 cluster bacterium]